MCGMNRRYMAHHGMTTNVLPLTSADHYSDQIMTFNHIIEHGHGHPTIAE